MIDTLELKLKTRPSIDSPLVLGQHMSDSKLAFRCRHLSDSFRLVATVRNGDRFAYLVCGERNDMQSCEDPIARGSIPTVALPR
jgi:hypothetical protein